MKIQTVAQLEEGLLPTLYNVNVIENTKRKRGREGQLFKKCKRYTRFTMTTPPPLQLIEKLHSYFEVSIPD